MWSILGMDMSCLLSVSVSTPWLRNCAVVLRGAHIWGDLCRASAACPCIISYNGLGIRFVFRGCLLCKPRREPWGGRRGPGLQGSRRGLPDMHLGGGQGGPQRHPVSLFLGGLDVGVASGVAGVPWARGTLGPSSSYRFTAEPNRSGTVRTTHRTRGGRTSSVSLIRSLGFPQTNTASWWKVSARTPEFPVPTPSCFCRISVSKDPGRPCPRGSVGAVHVSACATPGFRTPLSRPTQPGRLLPQTFTCHHPEAGSGDRGPRTVACGAVSRSGLQPMPFLVDPPRKSKELWSLPPVLSI